MPELARAVERLVGSATEGSDDAALRKAVDDVLTSFDDADTRERKAALGVFDKALARAQGRAAQVLYLALGALVEAGAPAELAWPILSRGLREALETATVFAQACVKHSGDPLVADAIEASAVAVAKKKPKEAHAWLSLPSRCLAAVACLTSSPRLRKAERADGTLHKAAYPLEDAVDEVGFLSQILRVLDDETLVVIHPESRRGFRVVVNDVASNLELFVLLADAIVGDAKKGLVPGKRPDARAVAALRSPASTPKKPPTAVVSFNLVAWTGLEADGTLMPADAEHPEHWVWIEGVPADIPPFGDERVVLLQEPVVARVMPVEPAFATLTPELRVTKKLTAGEVDSLLATMGKAAAKLREAQSKRAPAKKKSKAAKPGKKAANKAAAGRPAATPKAKAKTKK